MTMKSGEFQFSELIKKRYLEIIAILLFIIAVMIFVFTLNNPQHFLIAIPITIITLPILLYLTRRTIHGKDQEKSIEERAAFRKDIPDTTDRKMSRQARLDRVPGKPRVVSQQEWLHGQRVAKGIFYGKISSKDKYSFAIHGDKELWDYKMKESIIGGSKDKKVSMNQIIEEEELMIMEKLRRNLLLLEIENLQFYLDDSGPNFSFNFHDKSDYNFIMGIIVQLDKEQILSFNSILKRKQPFTLSLHKDKTSDKEEYFFNSNTSADWNFFKKVLMLEGKLSKIHESMDYLKIKKKNIEFGLTKSADLNLIFGLIKGIYEELLKL